MVASALTPDLLGIVSYFNYLCSTATNQKYFSKDKPCFGLRSCTIAGLFFLNSYIMKDLSGRKFGRLLVIKQSHQHPKRKTWYWHCLCDCGNTTIVVISSLTRGNTKSCGCLRIAYNGNQAESRAYDRYKRQAKDRNLEFNLTRHEFHNITQMECKYCGSPPSNKSTSKNSEYIYNGIDRVDNKHHYHSGNVVPCCIVCNRAKMDMDCDEFILWTKQLVKHQSKWDILNTNLGR